MKQAKHIHHKHVSQIRSVAISANITEKWNMRRNCQTWNYVRIFVIITIIFLNIRFAFFLHMETLQKKDSNEWMTIFMYVSVGNKWIREGGQMLQRPCDLNP